MHATGSAFPSPSSGADDYKTEENDANKIFFTSNIIIVSKCNAFTAGVGDIFLVVGQKQTL